MHRRRQGRAYRGKQATPWLSSSPLVWLFRAIGFDQEEQIKYPQPPEKSMGKVLPMSPVRGVAYLPGFVNHPASLRVGSVMLIDTFILCAVCAAGAFPGQDAYLAGHAAEAARDIEKAIASYEACARKDPALEAYARIRVGLCHLRSADLAAAEGAFRAVLKDYIEGPWAPMARVHLARTLQRQKKHAEAAPLFKAVLAFTPRPWWMEKYAWDSGENLLGNPLTRKEGFAFFREVADTTGWVGPRRDAAMKLLKSPSSADRAPAILGL